MAVFKLDIAAAWAWVLTLVGNAMADAADNADSAAVGATTSLRSLLSLFLLFSHARAQQKTECTNRLQS